GVFRMLVPRALGGGEVDPATMVRVLETIARADGAAGWSAMIGATSGVASAYLPEDAAHAIYGDANAITGGAFAALGRARPVDGGYEVRGRWPFASGCEHCTWLMGGCVLDDRPPEEARLALFPASAARIVDTWTVAGLRGTGSHAIAVDSAFAAAAAASAAPAPRPSRLVTVRPRHARPLYVFPVFGLLALGIAAVALGIARAAIDELVELAAAKRPIGSRRLLADRPTVQAEVA